MCTRYGLRRFEINSELGASRDDPARQVLQATFSVETKGAPTIFVSGATNNFKESDEITAKFRLS